MNKTGNLQEYLDRMTQSAEVTTKNDLVLLAQGPTVLDYGCGSGVLTHKLARANPDWLIYGLERNLDILEEASKNAMHNEIFCTAVAKNVKFDTIIFSSVLHEVYSYPVKEGDKPFDTCRVVSLLTWAYEALKPGGTLLIRDGAYNTNKSLVTIKFKKPDGITWLERFCKEFKAPMLLPADFYRNGENQVIIPELVAKEFLYTYTWGAESWAREIKERLGVFTKDEYRTLLRLIGFSVPICSEFLEPGYTPHLDQLVEYYPLTPNYGLDYLLREPKEYPDSTIFIVAKKEER